MARGTSESSMDVTLPVSNAIHEIVYTLRR